MALEQAKEIFKSLLRNSAHELNEDLQWSELTPLEKRTCLSSGTFDIDFLAFSGLAQNLINEKNIAATLSNLSGTFVKSPYLQSLHGYKFKKVLVFCDLKPFKLALTLNECRPEDEENVIQEESESQGECSIPSAFSKTVSELLGNDRGRTYAFRDIRFKVLSHFSAFEMVIFQFGQKQELDTFLTHVNNIDASINMSVAVGLEVFLKENLLFVTPENVSVGECFFPMLLSRNAGSILCTSKHAAKFARQSQRYVHFHEGWSAILLFIIQGSLSKIPSTQPPLMRIYLKLKIFLLKQMMPCKILYGC